MKLVVLVKQVPNTTRVKLDPKTGNLIREGLESIVNPDDLHALEAALGIKEETGGTVTALSMGPPQAVDALTQAIGMGADKGILLCDRAFAGADTWATSLTLSRAIRKLGEVDLIICGHQAIDGDTAQIGPQVADWLGLAQATYVKEIEHLTPADPDKPGKPGEIIVKRRLENGVERLACQLPALVTVIKELNQPRYAHMERLITACTDKADILVWNAADIGVNTCDVGLEGSNTHVIKTFTPNFKRQKEILEGSRQEVVAELFDRLKKSDTTLSGKFQGRPS
ncbi:MAG: electron transfer flavoprotein subunit beta/FixA family protein [Proteobacteria bacterium]|nr:electron transfer flavoprotein subunit beta/FixA family protein [Desulfobacula sp.]MBU4129616.1 electron transfer flavoprotein subunit beta/FixA family protein [Pseudomonadota bacterium]